MLFLERKWCAKHKATIDCERNIVKIFRRLKKLSIRALENSDSEISVYAVELKDKTAKLFTMAIKSLDKSISLDMHNDIGSLIHEYHNIFPDKLPYCLQPYRG